MTPEQEVAGLESGLTAGIAGLIGRVSSEDLMQALVDAVSQATLDAGLSEGEAAGFFVDLAYSAGVMAEAAK